MPHTFNPSRDRPKANADGLISRPFRRESFAEGSCRRLLSGVMILGAIVSIPREVHAQPPVTGPTTKVDEVASIRSRLQRMRPMSPAPNASLAIRLGDGETRPQTQPSLTTIVLGGLAESMEDEIPPSPLGLGRFETELSPQPLPPLTQQPPAALPPAQALPPPTKINANPSPSQRESEIGDGSANKPGSGQPTRFNEFIGGISESDGAIELIVGQGKTVTLKKEISTEESVGVIAVGDPSIVDFEVLPNPRFLRLLGKRVGVTDLSIVTAEDEVLTVMVRVLYDLELIQAQLRHLFPDTQIRITQMREHLVVEGQVRTIAQAAQVQQLLESWLESQQPQSGSSARGAGGLGQGRGDGANQLPTEMTDSDREAEAARSPSDAPEVRILAGLDSGARGDGRGRAMESRIVNLLRVPGTQQVLLQVRVAELNRTGLREIGADWLFASDSGNVVGTSIAGSLVEATATAGGGNLTGQATSTLGPNATAFGIFPTADLEIMLRALRRNSLLSVLAEPNLVAMSGHEASFLAGGQFPVPIQTGIGGTPSVQFKDYGVQLHFLPTIVDEDTVRLLVAPEVSTIDFSTGTVLVTGGNAVPGINTRRVETTVEMRQGETLALAGLLTVAIDAQTSRIPGLGDLPYIGPLFSNTTHQRLEKELLVLVTPYLVSPVAEGEDLPLPGQCIADPNDKEFYFLNRIEGRTGRPFHSPTSWDNPLGLVEKMELDSKCVQGPVGFSD
jgi:pilus assembly protein CpaC